MDSFELKAEMVATLAAAAAAARAGAYAPYSGYAVGAAVLAESGAVYAGANVENAAYPAGLCAERVAAAAAVSAGERRLLAVAVSTATGGAPCGVCRQFLAEFGSQLAVILVGADGTVRETVSLADLLPKAFGPAYLPQK